MRFPFHLKREMRDKYFRLPVELFSCVFGGKREWCGASELGHSLQLHRLPVSFSPFLCFATTCHSASPRPRSRTHTKTPFGGKGEKNKKNFVSHRVRISECKLRQRERGVIECWHWVAVSTGLQQGQSYTLTHTHRHRLLMDRQSHSALLPWLNSTKKKEPVAFIISLESDCETLPTLPTGRNGVDVTITIYNNSMVQNVGFVLHLNKWGCCLFESSTKHTKSANLLLFFRILWLYSYLFNDSLWSFTFQFTDSQPCINTIKTRRESFT